MSFPPKQPRFSFFAREKMHLETLCLIMNMNGNYSTVSALLIFIHVSEGLLPATSSVLYNDRRARSIAIGRGGDLEERKADVECEIVRPSSYDDGRHDEVSASRRGLLHATAAVILSPFAIIDSPSFADADDSSPTDVDRNRISVPLEYIPALNAYVVHYYLFGERFGAIVDSGSPFLTVPSTCSKFSYKYKWGCYHPEKTFGSGYANTIEGFDNNQGPVVWRKAGFAFNEESQPEMLTFGVFGPELLDGPGGVFLGLIRDTDKWIRPSFLGQTGYNNFCVDLRQTPQLVLSKEPMIRDDDDYIPLVRDLNRRYRAPVVHYTARASSFIVNDLPLKLDKTNPTYVIFDTGLSGMAVSEELFEGRNLQARKNREKSLWGEVRVAFKTRAGNEIELRATKPLTTPLGKDTPWTRVKGNLIVLGLAFLDGTALTIDIDDDKLAIATMA
jgi:hypothetical protein